MADDAIEAGSVCERIGCWQTFVVTLGRGRPRRYCSDECRRQADADRKRCAARVERLRDLLRREEHLLAAMGDAPEQVTRPGGAPIGGDSS